MLALERLLAPGRIAHRAEALRAERPVVVMGRGKSGTRLVAWACQYLGLAMGAAPQLATGDIDHRYFRDTIKALAHHHFALTDPERIPPADLQRFQHAAAAALRFLRLRPGFAGGWGWKWPETYLIAPIVWATFPGARFIHIVRDGRDVAFNHHLSDDPKRTLGRCMLRHLKALDRPHHIQAAASWEFQVRHYRAFAAGLPEGQRFEFHYEALCRDPLEVMGAVADFLGRPLTDACRGYLGRELTVGHLNGFRRRDARQVAEVEALIRPTLVELGYLPGEDEPHAAQR